MRSFKGDLPFLIPGEECFSTNSSIEKSNRFESSFSKELQKVSLMKDLREKNPVKDLRPLGRNNALFDNIKARNNSPIRDSLTILNRNHAIFPAVAPVAPDCVDLNSQFNGLEEFAKEEYEEDEDLKLIKEMYCQMVSKAEKPVR